VDVIRWNPEEDGGLNQTALRCKLERLRYRKLLRLSPGTIFPEHTHGVEKMDAVVSGRFKITMEGQAVLLGPGDAVRVPRGAAHSAEVVGDDEVVSLDGIRR
jgi:quercetin dioxygenase-like cupin family protein